MSTKFFNLISGDEIHRSPQSKIIPAEAFSTLLDGYEILERIKQDAEQYRSEVVSEAEKAKAHAEEEGYAEGYQKWSEHLVRLEEEIERVYQEMEKLIIPVALKAAKKIVEKELEVSNDAIVSIVAANLRAVSQHKKVTIYVNRKDLDILEKNKPQLKQIFESLESLSIRDRDDVTPGGCIIETEIGIVNAQIEHRWRILEKAFETLAKKTPAPKAPGS